MPALSEYSNVYNTALAVLREKGFQIWYDKERKMGGTFTRTAHARY
jgi:hypothetical protein